MTVTKTAYTALRPPWRIGVDVGGTFTDLVMADSAGATWVTKVLSVPEDPSLGVVAALERLAIDLGSEVREVLGNCHLFLHGSTVATMARGDVSTSPSSMRTSQVTPIISNTASNSSGPAA